MIILGITASSDKNAPTAPTSVTATDVGTGRAYNNGAITVAFTAPSYSGGSPITSYTATSNTGGYTATGASSPLTVTGIPSGTALTFTVTATNAAGFTSPASTASGSATATTVPQAPTIGTATAGSASATVTFTAGATGGKAVSTYTATSSPSSITGTAASSPITVSGLTNGTAYTFTVTATNANGTSTASAASNSVTPATPGNWIKLGEYTGDGSAANITFSGLTTGYDRFIITGSTQTNSSTTVRLRINGYTSGFGQQSFQYTGSTYNTGMSGTNQNAVIINGNNNQSTGTRPIYVDISQNISSQYVPSMYAQCMNGTTNTNSEVSFTTAGYSSQVTVSAINLDTGAGTFGTGTVLTLYGTSTS